MRKIVGRGTSLARPRLRRVTKEEYAVGKEVLYSLKAKFIREMRTSGKNGRTRDGCLILEGEYLLIGTSMVARTLKPHEARMH